MLYSIRGEMTEAILATTLPFANEFANILTSSGARAFKDLYVATPSSAFQTMSKTLIDLLALSGIVLGSVRAAEAHGKMVGVIKGVGTLLIAFVIPNLFLHAAMSALCRNCGPASTAATGMVLVGALVALEVLFGRAVLRVVHDSHESRHVQLKPL